MSYRESFDVKEIEDAQSIQLNTAEKLYLYKKAYDAKIDRSYRMLGFFGKAYVRFKCKRIIKQATERSLEGKSDHESYITPGYGQAVNEKIIEHGFRTNLWHQKDNDRLTIYWDDAKPKILK